MMTTTQTRSMLGSLPGKLSRPMARDKADALLLLVTCALVLVPHASHLPAWINIACAALLSWRGWVTFRGNRMPPRWLLLPLAVLSMVGVYWTYKTIFGREAGVSMLVLLLTFKLLEMHAKRDLFVILYLSFFLVLAGFFYSQGIGMAVMTIITVVAILTTQLSFQYTGAVPPLKQRLRLAAVILLLAAPLTLALFLLFPRIQGPLWGMPKDAQSARSGLSESMSPGNISQLALSEEIAFRAKFEGEPPPKAKLYWRGPVLGTYDGRIWFPSRSPSVQKQLVVKPRGEPVRYQVTLEPNNRRRLFALEMPQAVPVLTGNPTGIGPEMELFANLPISTRVRYDVVSYVDFDLQPNEIPEVLEHWLRLPRGFNPRTLALAESMRSKFGTDLERINAVLKYFREEKFHYTLEPPALGKHVTDEFLFDTRAGFCEHYSGAFVVLMRAMGIPSRVVTGYQGGEINRTDGFLTVRQSDAHAWSEVWLKGRGWTRVDPTAAVSPERISMNLGSALPRQMLGGWLTLDATRNPLIANFQQLRQYWDAINNAWNQSVLSYTAERQKSFLQSLGFEHVDWRTLGALMAVVGGLMVLLMTLPLMMHRSKVDPVEAIYRSLCKRMSKYGCPRFPHEGPRAYRMRLTAADSPLTPETKAAVARFLEYYETARYGPASRKPPVALVSQLKSLASQCR